MTHRFVVTATDTDVGKTVFSAALAGALGGCYWKPVQSGLADGGDSAAVSRLAGLPPEAILPERYRLHAPLSPHRAAELDNITIDPGELSLPAVSRPLIVEGAGGVLVPLGRGLLFADVFAQWRLPVILCARTALGTINHSLLSLEALRARGVPVHGIAFIGPANEDSEATITAIAGVRRLGRLPWIEALDQQSLAQAFAAHFRVADFTGEAA